MGWIEEANWDFLIYRLSRVGHLNMTYEELHREWLERL
jgi:hypothetical protein